MKLGAAPSADVAQTWRCVPVTETDAGACPVGTPDCCFERVLQDLDLVAGCGRPRTPHRYRTQLPSGTPPHLHQVVHRGPNRRRRGRRSDNGPLSLPPAIAFVPLARRHHVHPSLRLYIGPAVSVGTPAQQNGRSGAALERHVGRLRLADGLADQERRNSVRSHISRSGCPPQDTCSWPPVGRR